MYGVFTYMKPYNADKYTIHGSVMEKWQVHSESRRFFQDLHSGKKHCELTLRPWLCFCLSCSLESRLIKTKTKTTLTETWKQTLDAWCQLSRYIRTGVVQPWKLQEPVILRSYYLYPVVIINKIWKQFWIVQGKDNVVHLDIIRFGSGWPTKSSIFVVSHRSWLIVVVRQLLGGAGKIGGFVKALQQVCPGRASEFGKSLYMQI